MLLGPFRSGSPLLQRGATWGSTTPLPVIHPPSSNVQTLLCSGLKGNVTSEVTVHDEFQQLISQGDRRSTVPRRILKLCVALCLIWAIMMLTIRNMAESRSNPVLTMNITAPISSPPRPEKVARVRTSSVSSPPPTRKRTSSGMFQVDDAEPPTKKTEHAQIKSDGAFKKSKVLKNGRRKSAETQEGKETKIIERFDNNVNTTCVTAFKESDSWD